MGASKGGLRDRNEKKLKAWLDKDDPGRSSGRYNSEEPLEARQLEGRVILLQGAYERIDAYYNWKRKATKLVEAGEPVTLYIESDAVLLYLFGEWLAEVDPPASSAINQFIRTESVAGGWKELEEKDTLENWDDLKKKASWAVEGDRGWRALQLMEAKAKAGHEFSAFIAPFIRRGIEKVLDELDRCNFRLEVVDDIKYKNKYEQRDHERRVKRDHTWRYLYGRLLAIEGDGVKRQKAKLQLSRDEGVSMPTINRAIAFCTWAEAKKE